MKKHVMKTLLVLCMSLGIGAFAGVSGAAAQRLEGCEAEITADSAWLIQHDPHGSALNTFPFELKIFNRGSGDCNGRIRVTSTSTQPYLVSAENGQRVRYSLRDERITRDVTPPESPANPIAATLRVREGQLVANPYTVDVYPDQPLGAGRYIQYLTFEYISPNAQRVLATRTLPVIYEVRASALIGLKGEYTRVGGMRTINLGDLEDRDYSPRTVLTVDATRGYILSVSSQNLGQLRHEDPVWSIPYRLKLGGVSVDLSRRFELPRLSNKAVNDEYPLSFSVEGTANKRAGRYSDVLHFTVTTL